MKGKTSLVKVDIILTSHDLHSGQLIQCFWNFHKNRLYDYFTDDGIEVQRGQGIWLGCDRKAARESGLAARFEAAQWPVASAKFNPDSQANTLTLPERPHLPQELKERKSKEKQEDEKKRCWYISLPF